MGIGSGQSNTGAAVGGPPGAAGTTYRKLIRIGLIAAVIVAALGAAAWWFRPPDLHGILLQSPQQAGDFTLLGSTGQPVHLSDFRGKYVLLYFGYTFCPDVCPTTLNDLKRTMAGLGRRAKDVQVLMVSVDPERDTPERLAEYLAYFNPDFIGLTGALDQVSAAATAFGIFFEQHPGSSETGYLVDHTSSVTVIDPDGYVRMVFPYGTTGEQMAADLTYLMRY